MPMGDIDRRRAELKLRLRGRERLFGAWTSLFHTSIAEIFSMSGVDFVGIDIEHSTVELDQCRGIISATQAHGVPCLPRIAWHNPEAIKRLLDSGADGLIVPMVSDPGEVENLVQWSKYPPLGRRSFGMARAQGYGFSFDRYAGTWNDTSPLVIQIETVEGVRNVHKMVTNDDVDGAMVGPYDLSGSLGIPGQFEDERVLAAAAEVIAACRDAGKACGTQLVDPEPESVGRAFEQGYTFVVLSSDVFLLWKWAERMNALVDGFRTAS